LLISNKKSPKTATVPSRQRYSSSFVKTLSYFVRKTKKKPVKIKR
jgi:hypothetical protein